MGGGSADIGGLSARRSPPARSPAPANPVAADAARVAGQHDTGPDTSDGVGPRFSSVQRPGVVVECGGRQPFLFMSATFVRPARADMAWIQNSCSFSAAPMKNVLFRRGGK
jgi:hypothetical protein